MNKRILVGACLLAAMLLVLSQSFRTQAAPLAQVPEPQSPTPGPDGRIIYIVKENDNLWLIAALNGVKVETLRELNHLTSDIVYPGQKLLIGFAGPAGGTPTYGPAPTRAAVTPTATAPPGWGILCVLLYNDLNGDSMRQETEPSIQGGEISVSNRLGTVSLTAKTPSGGNNTTIVEPTPQERGYTCFDNLLQGEYLISVAAPEGYNRTTVLNQNVMLYAGQTTLLRFGAQANSELEAQSAIIPESPRKSPIIGIIGGMLFLAGISLGIYAALLRRTRSTKSE